MNSLPSADSRARVQPPQNGRVTEAHAAAEEAVALLAINPNTVLKAYQQLEQQGLVEGRQGQGTFVTGALPGPSPTRQAALRRGLDKWLRSAYDAGLDDEAILAIVETALRDQGAEQIA